jgi:hypothetical protein
MKDMPAEDTSAEDQPVAEVREARVFYVNPTPLGDTPVPGEPEDKPTEEIVTLNTTEETRPTLKIEPKESFKSITALDVKWTSLAAIAKDAIWDNGNSPIRFNGSERDQIGCVKFYNQALLSDNQTYNNVLHTHPRWQSNGIIRGVYNLTISPNAGNFSTYLGFLRGAAGSDGVRFVVAFRSNSLPQQYTILNRVMQYRDGPTQVSVPIPDAIKGKTGQLILIVQAMNSAWQDWAVWVDPRIY